MTPTITDQQRQALNDANNAGPVIVIDPESNAQYVLVRVDVFEWMRDLEPREAYPFVDRIMADDDALDPTLASYQGDAFPGKSA